MAATTATDESTPADGETSKGDGTGSPEGARTGGRFAGPLAGLKAARGRVGAASSRLGSAGGSLRHTTGFGSARDQVRRSLALLQAAHPRQGVATAAAVAAAAFVAGRPGLEVGLVALTVLVGQSVLGWHNDIVDAEDDRRAERHDKPVADGRLDPSAVWFAVLVGLFALLPLAVANGGYAAAAYGASLLVGLAGNVVLRATALSWLPWAVSYALLVPFLSYGGLGGQYEGDPPNPALVAVAALLGVGVHFLRALPGLVQDNRDRRRHLPLRVALRTGAPRLLLLSSIGTGLAAAGLVVVAAVGGLAL